MSAPATPRRRMIRLLEFLFFTAGMAVCLAFIMMFGG